MPTTHDLLTGADFDLESVGKDKNGNDWFGEEFGPFLVKTNAAGQVLKREVALPGVFCGQRHQDPGRRPDEPRRPRRSER